MKKTVLALFASILLTHIAIAARCHGADSSVYRRVQYRRRKVCVRCLRDRRHRHRGRICSSPLDRP